MRTKQRWSWSTWDAARTVDVHIVTVGGTKDGRPMTAETMLGHEPNTQGAGGIGHVVTDLLDTYQSLPPAGV